MAYQTKVYIGRLTEDIRIYRQTVVEVCKDFDLDPIHAEVEGLSYAEGVERIREELKRASVYIGLVGNRYGTVPPGWTQSILELEYELTGEVGVDRLYFFRDENGDSFEQDISPEEKEKLVDLRRKIRHSTWFGSFANKEDLVQTLRSGLRDWGRGFLEDEEEVDRMLPGDPTTDAPPPPDLNLRGDR